MNENQPSTDVEMLYYPGSKLLSDPDSLSDQWQTLYENGKFSDDLLRCYWKIKVPQLFTSVSQDGGNLYNITEDAELHHLLIYPLERFIFLDDPKTILENAKQFENCPSACGAVLHLGDPKYTCIDCALDNTCVFCAPCFNNSEHRNHRYKMGTSGGQSMCDCGDPEAWKSNPWCTVHAAKSNNECESDKQILSEKLMNRCTLIFSSIFHYFYGLLVCDPSCDLPSDLVPWAPICGASSFATVLYNDEIHTYDQVIQALMNAIGCTHKKAVELATATDREGRAIVGIGTYQLCSQIKISVEKQTGQRIGRPLKVLVVAVSLLMHQTFVIHLLAWMQKLINSCSFLSLALQKAILQQPKIIIHKSAFSLLESLMLSDTKLWKGARLQWHSLIISGLLADTEGKKIFACRFTRHYASIIKDFIEDDHEVTVSIISLLVQVYTVPTLAHYLIAEYDVIAVILKSFVIECEHHCNSDEKIHFGRQGASNAFRRAQLCLCDLKYILNVSPDPLTAELSHGFLSGVSQLLKLLTMMQGMDASVRQIDLHLEYEPDWETAFSIQIKLSPILVMVAEWCMLSRTLLIKMYRGVLRKLIAESESRCAWTTITIAKKTASCLAYDVASQQVSIHAPLTRLLAALYPHLQIYNLKHDGIEFNLSGTLELERIMEPALRAQVLLAQVQAGMWRRNGFSLLNQVYFYKNVRFRAEMLDKDISLLQAVGAMSEPNSFVIQLINRFGLISWVKDEFDPLTVNDDENQRHLGVIAEEFLGLLISLIGERHQVGIGQIYHEDTLQKEIIHQLCLEPMSHSQLTKALPIDSYRLSCLEDAINKVADFVKPVKGAVCGKYELRNPYHDQFDMYFYHYSREEQSRAEQAQRKRRRERFGQDFCIPPILPQFTKAYEGITNILYCDVYLHLLCKILHYVAEAPTFLFTESHLHRALYLINYALQHNSDLLCQQFQFWNISNLLEKVIGSTHVTMHRDFAIWTYQNFQKAMESIFMNNVQNATLAAQIDRSVQAEKRRRTELVEARKARILAQMSAIQRTFMEENAAHFEDEIADDMASPVTGVESHNKSIKKEQLKVLGNHQKIRYFNDVKYTCILCQEEQFLSSKSQTLVMCALVQHSTVLSQKRGHIPQPSGLFLRPDLCNGPHLNTCGHVLHEKCWQSYCNTSASRRREQTLLDSQEFLCPLCDTLSNAIIPLFLPASKNCQCFETETSIEECLNLFNQLAEKKQTVFSNYKGLACILQSQNFYDSGDSEIIDCLKKLNTSSTSESIFPVAFSFGMTQFSESIYAEGLPMASKSNNNSFYSPLASWQACAYTIIAKEWQYREQKMSLFNDTTSRLHEGLGALIRACGVLSIFNSFLEVDQNIYYIILNLLFMGEVDGMQLLEQDAFGLLITSVCVLPSILHVKEIPQGNILDLLLTQLLTLMHTVQILLSCDDSSPAIDHDISQCNESDVKCISCLYEIIWKKPCTNPLSVYSKLRYGLTPFLSCVCLFWHHMTGVPLPEDLCSLNNDTFFDTATSYLGLKDMFQSLLSYSTTLKIIYRWTNKIKNLNMAEASYPMFVKYPLTVNHLITLPEDYGDLINSVSTFTCPNSSGDDSRIPTMCLVCGQILCSQSYCCQKELDGILVGACTFHAYFCGGGVGIFLRIRECKLIMLASVFKGCFYHAPYLDEYGETDSGLKRGYPLHLSAEHYQKLNNLWLSHDIPMEVARKIKSSRGIISSEWNYL